MIEYDQRLLPLSELLALLEKIDSQLPAVSLLRMLISQLKAVSSSLQQRQPLSVQAPFSPLPCTGLQCIAFAQACTMC